MVTMAPLDTALVTAHRIEALKGYIARDLSADDYLIAKPYLDQPQLIICINSSQWLNKGCMLIPCYDMQRAILIGRSLNPRVLR